MSATAEGQPRRNAHARSRPYCVIALQRNQQGPSFGAVPVICSLDWEKTWLGCLSSPLDPVETGHGMKEFLEGGRNDKDTENQRWDEITLRVWSPKPCFLKKPERHKTAFYPFVLLLFTASSSFINHYPQVSLSSLGFLRTQSQHSLQSHLRPDAHFFQRKASFVSWSVITGDHQLFTSYVSAWKQVAASRTAGVWDLCNMQPLRLDSDRPLWRDSWHVLHELSKSSVQQRLQNSGGLENCA